MAVNLSFIGGAGWQFFTDNGTPLSGGKIYTYAAGSTTPLVTYTSRTGITPNANPIILDAAGRTPEQIWSTEGLLYKYVVTDANDVQIRVWDNIGNTVVASDLGAALASTTNNDFGDALIGFRQSNSAGFLIDAVGRTLNDKMQESVSVADFGAVGDGVTDDTTAILAALNASYNVIVPAGFTCRISATITVPSRTRLNFLGGPGNLPFTTTMPGSYFIKPASMTTPGIIIEERGMVQGGGLLCETGNTGDGVQLIGNRASLINFYVTKAGQDGVRVGSTPIYRNTNSTYIQSVKSSGNGRYGFYVHDGYQIGPADANAGVMLDIVADSNGSDGIRIGHAFWVSIINAVSEINLGYGLYLSGAVNAGYPESRWINVIGGDFNEGNNSTVNVNQVYDGSYFSSFVQADKLSVPSNAPTGVQGGGLRNSVSAQANHLQGLTVNTSVTGVDSNPLTITAGRSGTSTYSFVIKQTTVATNGFGPGIKFQIDPNTATFADAAKITAVQFASDQYGLRFSAYKSGAIDAVDINPNAFSFAPATDNVWSCGFIGRRWTVVYAATGAINTSDEREKQDILPLDEREQRVAKRLKMLVRKFRFRDAVEAKGDGARIHVGVIAQDVVAAFAAEGLDANCYGLLCHDTWPAEVAPDGAFIRAAGDRYGVRYDELLAFIVSAI